jgi:hypothetical protein
LVRGAEEGSEYANHAISFAPLREVFCAYLVFRNQCQQLKKLLNKPTQAGQEAGGGRARAAKTLWNS